MITVRKQKDGEKWMVVKERKVPRKRPLVGTLQQVVPPYRIVLKFWSGDLWVGQNAFAMLFGTEEDARQYLDDNRKTIESTKE